MSVVVGLFVWDDVDLADKVADQVFSVTDDPEWDDVVGAVK